VVVDYKHVIFFSNAFFFLLNLGRLDIKTYWKSQGARGTVKQGGEIPADASCFS
jgi:hypothetical protein